GRARLRVATRRTCLSRSTRSLVRHAAWSKCGLRRRLVIGLVHSKAYSRLPAQLGLASGARPLRVQALQSLLHLMGEGGWVTDAVGLGERRRELLVQADDGAGRAEQLYRLRRAERLAHGLQ